MNAADKRGGTGHCNTKRRVGHAPSPGPVTPCILPSAFGPAYGDSKSTPGGFVRNR